MTPAAWQVIAATRQRHLLGAIAPQMPGYDLDAGHWLSLAILLRQAVRTTTEPDATYFLDDLARACDAMHRRLNGDESYVGDEIISKVEVD